LKQVPSAREASGLIYMICQEMPNMKDCELCPPPANGVSNCDILSAYSKLCLDMPGMSQCAKWDTFCKDSGNLQPFCPASKTASSTPSPTNKQGSASRSYIPSSLLFLAPLFL
jgi:hypothetical protein